MRDEAQGLIKKGVLELLWPIEGFIAAFDMEGDHYRLVGKTDGGVDISVDVGRGGMLVDLGGLVIRARGEHAGVRDGRFAVHDTRGGIHAELDVEPGSRFKLKFELRR